MLRGEGASRKRSIVVGLMGLIAIGELALAFVVLGGDSSRAAPLALPLHPVVSDFAPDVTRLSECSGPACFEQALGNVAYTQGPEAALELVDTVYDEADPWCHRAVHTIGAATLARNKGNVALTFAEGSPKCWSGYYHGVLERSLLGVKSYEPDALGAAARPLCEEAKQTMPEWIAYQCVHGLGHGLMITTGLHLPRSLAVCRRLATRWDRSACKGGVFMENMQPSYGFRSRWLRDDDPVYPCNVVARADKYRCYQLVTSRILPAVGDDWERASEVCSRVERDFVYACFRALGRDASSRSGRDAAGVLEICAVTRRFSAEDDCLYGATNDMLANDMNGRRAKALCDRVPVGFVSECWSVIGGMLRSFHTTTAASITECRALTQEPAHLTACIGASAPPRS